MQVHFFAAARSAAGTAQLSVPLAELRSATLGALIEHPGPEFGGYNPFGSDSCAGHGAVLVPGQRCPLGG